LKVIHILFHNIYGRKYSDQLARGTLLTVRFFVILRMGLIFHNRKVVFEFLTIVVAMFVVPLSTYFVVYHYISILIIETDANRMVAAGLTSVFSV